MSKALIEDVNQKEEKLNKGYDGIICMGGEDWWYHNRGHYDMQMMREFSKDVPVIYVNSIGTRFPKVGEGKVFLARAMRKLKSLSRGLVKVREKYWVLTPFALPGSVGNKLTSWVFPLQIKMAAKKCGISKPLLWVTCPPGVKVMEKLPIQGLVYQRTDKHEAYPDVNREEILRFDQILKEHGDVVIYCNKQLFDEEKNQCKQALYVDHGVDYERFVAAGDNKEGEPADVKDIPHPRVGLIGEIEEYKIDRKLFVEVIGRLQEVQFVHIGDCSLPDGWCPYANLTMLGRKEYETVADYMAACDVLIIPLNQGEWAQASNPVKLKEYLAVGRPVVSAPFPELENYQGVVKVAKGTDEFVQGILQALAEQTEPSSRRQRVEKETWEEKGKTVLRCLEELGVKYINN
ncbi:MAG: glycosyltransferase [Gomphosphaeria aponina SAG 52.96 = DSM 107014]|uniref:Glycosyltransferase n=1 Tax=Gomphosphaeria aponina SAG 52.96 = DSM 107014 TaxID=1521640 RepID=A0A941GN98_9CHRO|nr:glycosyltransferase [Gomphosphaeria aponina SAG 52.96 = DSM 107014]